MSFNDAIAPNNSVLDAIPIIELEYGIKVIEDDLIECAYWFLKNETNSLARKIFQIVTPTDENYIIKLPCNCEYIESVALFNRDHDYSKYKNSLTTITDSLFPNIKYISFNNIYKTIPDSTVHSLKPSGAYISYNHLGDSIEISEKNRKFVNPTETLIEIIYRGFIPDETGLPKITAKEVRALAYYYVFIVLKKQVFQRVAGASELLTLHQPMYEKALSEAFADEYWNQNTMEDILNANSLLDRKMYKKNYKPIR